jgi:hypothetical protein
LSSGKHVEEACLKCHCQVTAKSWAQQPTSIPFTHRMLQKYVSITDLICPSENKVPYSLVPYEIITLKEQQRYYLSSTYYTSGTVVDSSHTNSLSIV